MIKESMTVYEALTTLKTIDAKISGKIVNSNFCVENKNSNAKIGGKTVNEFIDDASSSIESIIALINRRKAIKNALSQSNAMTKVIIGGKEYTVAEAIEMKKTGLQNIKNFLYELNNQLSRANNNAKAENDRLEGKADVYVTGLFGGKEKATGSEAIAVREAYVSANGYSVVAPKNIQKIIEDLQNEAYDFEAEVDSKLGISNALTTISIEY